MLISRNVDLHFVGGFANSKVLCTHLVWHRPPDGAFLLVDEEENYTKQQSEEPLAKDCVGESDA